MTTIETSASQPAETLRGLCVGRVHLPGDPGYDAARLPWNVAVDQRPAAVAIPRSAEEVAEVVRAAAATGLRIAPQSTGHAAAALPRSASTTWCCSGSRSSPASPSTPRPGWPG